MSGATIINILAVIGAGTCLYWLVRIVSAFLRRIQPPAETDAPVPAATLPPEAMAASDDIAKDDIAVITAVVHSMMQSGHRIVHISDGRNSASWSAEGRWMHQTSHNPH
ncbi:MAG TPA: OadG family protein [Telmatospirillum sp.]|nr:OadG family protein [Telmatospirillum sp.]